MAPARKSAGAGGNVTVTIENGNDIGTAGDYSDGILAQSVGGGGGRGLNGDGLVAMGDSGGNAASATVTNYTAISTTKEDATGVLL